jgi:hypothetical protein
MSIPGVSLKTLQTNYPKTADPKEVVKDTLGASHWLMKDPDLNTCAIRLSRAFNYGGAPLKRMTDVHFEMGTDGLRYLIRADDFVKYCRKHFGKPDVTKEATNAADLQAAIGGKPGVLFFRLTKETSPGKTVKRWLYGHADVWDGAAVWYNDVLFKTWEVTLWSV